MAFGDPSSQRPMPGPGRGSYGWPMVVPGEGFNALLGQFAEEFGAGRERNAAAFGWYEQKKAREQDAYERANYERQRAYEDQKRREAEANRLRMEQEAKARAAKDEAMRMAQAEEQKRIQASMGRNRGILPAYDLMNPAGVLADYYEYGAGNPQGRGGGGSAPQELTNQQFEAVSGMTPSCPPGTRWNGGSRTCDKHEPFSMG